MSRKKNRQVAEAAVEVAEEVAVVEPIEEANIKAPEFKNGFVTNCAKLNLRSAPKRDAAVVQVLEIGAEVRIDEAESTNDFYKVQFGNVEGFCMKRYIAIEQ